MSDKHKELIQIKLVMLSNNGSPAYVEWFSHTDSRNHIAAAEKFCDMFGYTFEELEQIALEYQKTL